MTQAETPGNTDPSATVTLYTFNPEQGPKAYILPSQSLKQLANHMPTNV